MTSQSATERSRALVEEMVRAIFTSTIRWVLAAADVLERQGRGSLVLLGSPAGDRGRRENFLYGATKAGLETLVEGVAHRFAGRGPRATLVKPGPTATAMTAGEHGRRLDPQRIAEGIRRAAEHGQVVQYVPAQWGFVMFAVRAIPTMLFNRLDF